MITKLTKWLSAPMFSTHINSKNQAQPCPEGGLCFYCGVPAHPLTQCPVCGRNTLSCSHAERTTTSSGTPLVSLLQYISPFAHVKCSNKTLWICLRLLIPDWLWSSQEFHWRGHCKDPQAHHSTTSAPTDHQSYWRQSPCIHDPSISKLVSTKR